MILLICAPGAQAATQNAEPPPPEQAPQPYMRDCAWCHGPRGEGTNRGPALAGVGAASTDFNLRSGRMPIEEPHEPPRRSEPVYDAGEIDQITRYVAGLGDGPAIPDIRPESGDIGLGAELYRDHCAACHSVTGSGGALSAGNISPSLIGIPPLEVAEAMIIGGEGTFTGSMPVFGPEVLDEHQFNSVLRYVEYLQDPQHRGGASLGGTGPVGEGFVVLFLALPVLIWFMRWAGSR